jgi:hypothetical protein
LAVSVDVVRSSSVIPPLPTPFASMRASLLSAGAAQLLPDASSSSYLLSRHDASMTVLARPTVLVPLYAGFAPTPRPLCTAIMSSAMMSAITAAQYFLAWCNSFVVRGL